MPRDTSVAVSGTGDSVRVGVGGRKGDIETTVKYKAKDSIRFEIQNRIADLYRESSINYGDMSLDAARITIDYSKNIITAEGQADSTGRVQGRPYFKNGAEAYQAGRIAYNIKTKRGRITDAVTQQGEGYVHAEVVKKNELNEIFGRNGRYTTCNLEHPHFYINATKMKVIPGQKVVTGPFNLSIGDIPTPLGFLFGYFPTPGKTRASGLIFPTFGQAADRGFFLRNGGFYWAANEYIGVRVTGDIYSGALEQWGGFNVTTELSYRKRYAYDGRLGFDYAERPSQPLLRSDAVNTNPNTITRFTPRTFWLNWSHTPVARPGGGRFSANVRTGNPEYNFQNSLNERNYLTPAFNSTISYAKQIRNSPVNYNITASQDLNTQTGTINATLPDVSVGVARQYLYELLGLSSQGKWYEQLAAAYTFTGQSRFSNTEAARTLTNGVPLLGGTTTGRTLPISLNNLSPLLRNNQLSLNHRFDIALGSYPVLKHLNFTPSVSYGESWYLKRLDYTYVEAARAVRIDTLRGFNRVYNASAGASLQTNIYGTIVRKGTRKIQAIRHRLSPSLNYSYSPDFTKNENLYDLNVLPAELIDPTTGKVYLNRDFSRFQGFGGNIPSGIEVNQISFAVQNQIEMKVRNSNDTTGTEPFKKVSLIDGLDFSSGYNFADTLHMRQGLAGSLRTQVAQKLNVIVSSAFSFYQRDTLGRDINKYLWQQANPRLARLNNASVNLTYQFDSSQKRRQPANAAPLAPNNNPALGSPVPIDPYADYVDFTIPWTLSASANAFYQSPGPVPRGQPMPRAWSAVSLNLNGQLKLTDKMRVGYSTGYDFISKQVSFTSLDFYRDLHCWQISGNWWPFGQRQGFNVTIGAKSSLLQDLKLNRNRTFLNR
ncbi:putative LPS assembly protein LptD [Hymenobacter koreensis]|uniref:LPS assembly protein LptD n=1 Tax=Hymenobacter koreensis TaxID=1084523 RepID=A0ABP8IVK6_9BACT